MGGAYSAGNFECLFRLLCRHRESLEWIEQK